MVDNSSRFLTNSVYRIVDCKLSASEENLLWARYGDFGTDVFLHALTEKFNGPTVSLPMWFFFL